MPITKQTLNEYFNTDGSVLLTPDINQEFIIADEIDNVSASDITKLNALRLALNNNNKLHFTVSGRIAILKTLTNPHPDKKELNIYSFYVENLPKEGEHEALSAITSETIQYRLYNTQNNNGPILLPTNARTIINNIRDEWENNEKPPTSIEADNKYISDDIIRKLNFYAYALSKMKKRLDDKLLALKSTTTGTTTTNIENDRKLAYDTHKNLKTTYKKHYDIYRKKWRESDARNPILSKP